MDIVIIRPFFIIGTRKIDDVCSTFAREIVKIEKGLKANLKIGNLEITPTYLKSYKEWLLM